MNVNSRQQRGRSRRRSRRLVNIDQVTPYSSAASSERMLVMLDRFAAHVSYIACGGVSGWGERPVRDHKSWGGSCVWTKMCERVNKQRGLLGLVYVVIWLWMGLLSEVVPFVIKRKYQNITFDQKAPKKRSRGDKNYCDWNGKFSSFFGSLYQWFLKVHIESDTLLLY